MAAATDIRPSLSVVTPTFNNAAVLRQSVDGWRRFGGDSIELIVVEDGCSDGTASCLRNAQETPWGRSHLRWVHEDDAHELRCTNRGFSEARGALLAAWQDDMFLQAPWFVPEIVATFDSYPELGLLSLRTVELDQSSGSGRRHPAVDRPARLSREGGHARRSVQAHGVGRSRSCVPHP